MINTYFSWYQYKNEGKQQDNKIKNKFHQQRKIYNQLIVKSSR